MTFPNLDVWIVKVLRFLLTSIVVCSSVLAFAQEPDVIEAPESRTNVEDSVIDSSNAVSEASDEGVGHDPAAVAAGSELAVVAAADSRTREATKSTKGANISADEGPRGAAFHREPGWSIGAPTITYGWRLKKMNLALGTRWTFAASAFFNAPSGNAFVWVGQQKKNVYQMKCYGGVNYLDLSNTALGSRLTAIPAGCYTRFTTRKPKFWVTVAAEGVVAIGKTEIAVKQQLLSGSVASSFIRFGGGVTWRLGDKWLLDSRVWILPSEFIQTAARTTVDVDDRTTAEVVVIAPGFDPFPFGAEVEISLRFQPTERVEMSLGIRAGNLALQSIGIAVPGINFLPLASATWRPRSRRPGHQVP